MTGQWVSYAERGANRDWKLWDDRGINTEHVQRCLLMDIRGELRSIRQLLQCHRIPTALDALARLDRLGVKRRVTKKRKK